MALVHPDLSRSWARRSDWLVGDVLDGAQEPILGPMGVLHAGLTIDCFIHSTFNVPPSVPRDVLPVDAG